MTSSLPRLKENGTNTCPEVEASHRCVLLKIYPADRAVYSREERVVYTGPISVCERQTALI